MRCSSYCTAAEYKISELVQYLKQNELEPKYFDEVIYVTKPLSDGSVLADIFFFPFGCIVIWGANEAEEKLILNMLDGKEINKLHNKFSDFNYFQIDPTAEKTHINEENNEIILTENSSFLKFSITYALAQSVKLNVLESSVSDLLERTAPLQKELAVKGSVSLSKTEISKQIGVLFSERYLINLHSDILDTPEFFWRRPSYEPLYLMTAEFQDIQVRQQILNHRLNMIHELYTLLSNELNYKHSTRLEWIIILLITFEVILGISHNNLFLKLFS